MYVTAKKKKVETLRKSLSFSANLFEMLIDIDPRSESVLGTTSFKRFMQDCFHK